MLSGVNVALGVTGSIAAVRTVQLAHELRRRGAAVRAVTTEAAQGIVHPWALEFATDRPPVTELTGAVEHVELCGREGWADVLLIAPATANTLGKVASTIDDSPVTTCATTALGADVPVVVAPAMHEPMYDHPGLPDVLDRLDEWGVATVDPVLAEGKAKMASDDAIAVATARAARQASERDSLAGQSVVVTAGATAEAVDPVRVLTNRASGRTGRAVARACYVRGADVTLVHGPIGPHPPSESVPDVGAANGADGSLPYADLEEVETVAEMQDALDAAVPDADALLAAAAVGDYTVTASEEKLASGSERTVDLEPTPKLIDGVRDARPDLPIVGFKTETAGEDALVEAARSLRERVDAAFVVANDASVMGADRTRALLVEGGTVTEVEGDKATLGAAVADRLADHLGGT